MIFIIDILRLIMLTDYAFIQQVIIFIILFTLSTQHPSSCRPIQECTSEPPDTLHSQGAVGGNLIPSSAAQDRRSADSRDRVVIVTRLSLTVRPIATSIFIPRLAFR